jgi:hypothetical protein
MNHAVPVQRGQVMIINNMFTFTKQYVIIHVLDYC